MNKMFTQPTGPVAKQTNKQAIARVCGVKQSQVAYLTTEAAIDSYTVLYDPNSQTVWFRGTATGTPVSWSVSSDTLTLVTESGTFTLLPANLKDMLTSTDPTYGANLVTGARKYFKVTDYENGNPDSTLSRSSDGTLTIVQGTDNTSAVLAAIADAQQYNGIVYFPAPSNGKAYLVTQTIAPAVTTGALWRGASLLGDGKSATKIICAAGDVPAVHVVGTSGWPSNIFLQGISLYSATDFVGEGWKLQGITGVRLTDFAAYRFGDGGLSFSNGSASGIFTEFNIVEDGWLENNNTNIKFRKDNGDGSFHGITLRNIINNNVPGQTGLDIGTSCVIYNADWNQVTFFGAAGVQWILNNGARNGFETLYFEGNGTVTNNSSWSTDGYWRIQNNTGIINDTSTVPFTNAGYITPTQPTDSNFASAGFTQFQAIQPILPSQAYRGLMRLVGSNAEAIAVTGYDSGAFESQGIAMVSQSSGDSLKDLILRNIIHLNGITSYRPEWRLNYAGGATQLSINSTGRHTGIMGRRSAGSITANAAAQTISVSGLLPAVNQAYDVSIVITTSGVTSKFTGVFCGFYDTTATTTLKVVDTPRSAGTELSIGVSSAVKITSDGNVTITLTATADCTYSITVIGKGTY